MREGSATISRALAKEETLCSFKFIHFKIVFSRKDSNSASSKLGDFGNECSISFNQALAICTISSTGVLTLIILIEQEYYCHFIHVIDSAYLYIPFVVSRCKLCWNLEGLWQKVPSLHIYYSCGRFSWPEATRNDAVESHHFSMISLSGHP